MGREEDEGKRRNSDNSSVETGEEEKIPYPKSVFFILSTESCERFSYYGMRAILSLYLKHLFTTGGMEDGEAEDLSSILYHTFVFLSYFTSLFGAFLADSFLGKFKTIFYISIVYAIGQVTLSLGAVPDSPEGISGMPQEAVSFIGLFLIAFGTGGIKPCVVSFGADQFKLPQQEAEMSTFFGVFYAAINFGSMISTILTPIFRQTPCLGEENCYSLAFGVPAALMVVAIISFVIGRPGYTIKIPDRNIVKDFVLTIWALMRRKPEQAEQEYGKQFIVDTRAVLKVLVIFLPFPLFWALFDQTGSRWTFQATRMDGAVGESSGILPDQMQVVNAAFILIFIPIFDRIIYPVFGKFNMLKTPLQKIVSGGMLMAVSFVVAALIEIQLEKTYPSPPEVVDGMATQRLGFHNALPAGCDLALRVTSDEYDFIDRELTVAATRGSWFKSDGKALLPFKAKSGAHIQMDFTAEFATPGDCPYDLPASMTTTVKAGKSHTVTFLVENEAESNMVYAYPSSNPDEVEKPSASFPNVRVIANLPHLAHGVGARLILATDEFNAGKHDGGEEGVAWEMPISWNADHSVSDTPFDATSDEGYLRLCVRDDENKNTNCAKIRGQTFFGDVMEADFERPDRTNPDWGNQYYRYKFGGSFNLYVGGSADPENPGLEVDVEEVTEANSMSMFWLLPQYMVLTAGEVLFSITSLEFAFMQSPKSMKAVVQALFLLTTAAGNLIDLIVIVALAGVFSSQWHEFLLFAGVMVLDMFWLMYLSVKYEYVDYTNEDANNDTGKDRSSLRRASITSLDH